MATPSRTASERPLAWRLLLGLAALQFALHVLSNGRFGMFRDEYYYLACADHLAWGYVDHPPLSIALLAAWRAALGDGVWAIRLLPAAAGAALVFLTGALARELGGRRAAQTLAALAVLIMPALLVTTGFYSMNAFEPLVWLGALLLLVRALRGDGLAPWLWLGALLGLGLLNKISVLLLGAGLAVGLVATPARRAFATPGPWLAGAIALALFAPHLVWQQRHGWPTLEFMANAQAHKMIPLPPAAFLGEVALETHPGNLLLWVVGLGWLFAARSVRERRWLRPLAWIWPVAAAVLILRHGKPYYLAPAQPLLLAAGAVAVVGWLERHWRFGAPLLIGLTALGGAFTLPLALPLLSPAETVDYLAASHLHGRSSEHGHEDDVLPQHFGDRFGWPEIARAVADATATLSPEERADCLVLCTNYGEAGAIDYYRKRGLDLPPVVCGHNSYWDWWPEGRGGETAIGINLSVEALLTGYEEVTLFRVLDTPYAIPKEGRAAITICRHRRVPLEEARPYYRHLD